MVKKSRKITAARNVTPLLSEESSPNVRPFVPKNTNTAIFSFKLFKRYFGGDPKSCYGTGLQLGLHPLQTLVLHGTHGFHVT